MICRWRWGWLCGALLWAAAFGSWRAHAQAAPGGQATPQTPTKRNATAQSTERSPATLRGIELARAERRIALVIGNSGYTDAPLRNPGNDAALIAETLKRLGFDVSLGLDLDLNEMRRAIRSFGRDLYGGGVGLFYYAGHAMQLQGSNYLVPIGAQIVNEDDVSVEAVNLAEVLAKMAGARNRLNVVVLDACRNNPFERSFRSGASGLAQITAPTGTLIAYATAPNSVASDGPGEHGLYTEALALEMQRPGLQVEDVFKAVREQVLASSRGLQVPWESSSIIGDFYFNTAGVQPDRVGPIPRGRLERIVRAESSSGVAKYIAGGAGVVALAAGAAFGVLAIANKNKAERLCPDMSDSCPADAVSISSTALLQANLSNVGFGVGLLGLGIAAYLWLTERTDTTREHALARPPVVLRPEASLVQATLTLDAVF